MSKLPQGIGILLATGILVTGWILWPDAGPNPRTQSTAVSLADGVPSTSSFADFAQPLWPAATADNGGSDYRDGFSSSAVDVRTIDEPRAIPSQEECSDGERCRDRVDLCVAPFARMDDSLSEAVDVPQLRPILAPAKMPPAEMDDRFTGRSSPVARSNELRIASRGSNQPFSESYSEPAPAAPVDANGESGPPNVIDQRMMNHVSQQADLRIREGYNLAERGALYAARDEFIGALRVIAQALDLSQATRSHSRALASGIRCLEESDDFIPSGTQMEADLDIAMIVSAHQTPILKNAKLDEMSALGALQSYYTFAQDRLASAVAGQPSGSAALCALGKLSIAMSNETNSHIVAGPSKAVVYHQAALIAHGKNAEASNELGVLLAKVGMYQAARDVLLESVSITSQAANWHNLAVVQHHLGKHDLASLAEAEARKAQAAVTARSQTTGTHTIGNYQIRMVPPAVFARTSRPTVAANQAVPGSAGTAGPPNSRGGRR